MNICAILVFLSCYFGRILLWGHNCAVYKAFRNDPPTVGRRDAVRLTLPEYDRVGGEQGYAGTGKTAMLNRALLEKRGYGAMGLAPSAPAARTLEAETGIASETLRRFLARSETDRKGECTVFFELNGQPRTVRAAERSAAAPVEVGDVLVAIFLRPPTSRRRRISPHLR